MAGPAAGDRRQAGFPDAQIDKLAPGDMPDFDPGLKMAHEALMEKDRDLAVRACHHHQRRHPPQTDRQHPAAR